jgi:hypothetical protein
VATLSLDDHKLTGQQTDYQQELDDVAALEDFNGHAETKLNAMLAAAGMPPWDGHVPSPAEYWQYVAKYGVHPPNAGDNAAAAASSDDSDDDSDDDGNDDNSNGSNGSIALPTLSEDENVRLVRCFQIKEDPKVSGEFAAFVVTLVKLLTCPFDGKHDKNDVLETDHGVGMATAFQLAKEEWDDVEYGPFVSGLCRLGRSDEAVY